VCRDPGERRLHVLQIAEHRVAEDRVAITGLAARLRSGLRAGSGEVDETGRIGHRQLPQQQLIEQ
jgi:hypothetical protein